MINVSINDKQFVSEVLSGLKERKPFNGEEVTLFWSGGVDSTYMLFWLLAEGYEVHTVYCDLDNNFMKVKRENWARNKIKDWVDANMPDLGKYWFHNQTPISKMSITSGGVRSALAQAPVWLLGTQFKGDAFRGFPSTYVMAYVNGDDALHWIPAFNKIVEGYNMLAKEGQEVTVLFPLASIKKAWFYEALKPIYGLMTWCEMPTLKKNCDCPACVRHKHELTTFEGEV